VKDIDFSPEEAISFDGETGPYVQYAHARCRNVLRRAGLGAPGTGGGAPTGARPAVDGAPAGAGAAAPPAPHPVYAGAPEWALLTALARFPAAARDAMQRCEPHLAARALLDLAQALSHFYHESPVLRAEPGAREARLALVAATATVLRRGLWLLGLEAPPMRDDTH